MTSIKVAPFAMAAAQALAVAGSSAVWAETATAPAAAIEVTPTFAEKKPAVDKKTAVSYAVGVTTARNLLKDGVDIDPAIILKGINDAIAGKTTLLSESEIKSQMNALVSDMRQRFVATRKNTEDSNRKRGEDFRVAFARMEGVKTLPDGVLVKEITRGTGAVPGQEDTVEVSYKGTLVDGKEFDSTADGKTTTFQLNKLIPGWRQALSIMPTGSHWKIVVPSELAYGDRGIGTDVGPNETLVFDVVLHGVTKAQ